MAAKKPKLAQTVHESERNFRLLVEGITDYALYMLDLEGHVTNWNKGAQRIKGYKAKEIIGEHFSIFYTPEDQASGLPATALKKLEAKNIFLLKDGASAKTVLAFSPRLSLIRFIIIAS